MKNIYLNNPVKNTKDDNNKSGQTSQYSKTKFFVAFYPFQKLHKFSPLTIQFR